MKNAYQKRKTGNEYKCHEGSKAEGDKARQGTNMSERIEASNTSEDDDKEKSET